MNKGVGGMTEGRIGVKRVMTEEKNMRGKKYTSCFNLQIFFKNVTGCGGFLNKNNNNYRRLRQKHKVIMHGVDKQRQSICLWYVRRRQ